MAWWNFARSGIYALFTVVFFITAVKACMAQGSTCTHVEVWTKVQIQETTDILIAEAERNPTGIATLVIERCMGSRVLLSVRAKSGRAELHVKDSNYLFILNGVGKMMTGGVIANPKHTAAGESRGENLDGGSATLLNPGVTIHIPPGMPHQTPVRSSAKLIVKTEEARR